MDRNLARKNIRTGLIVTARLRLFMFGIDLRRRGALRLMSDADAQVPPAGEEIHLPGRASSRSCSRSA